MNTILSTDKQYKEWFIEVKQKVQSAQIKAALRVNQELLNLYWELGREIHEKQQEAHWGEALIEQLSKDLSAAFPGVKGFSRRNMFYIRQWYLFYSDNSATTCGTIIKKGEVQADHFEFVPQLVGQIPWGHNREIITKCKDIPEALFYVRQTIKNNWSRAILLAQIESKLYQRQGKAIDNFEVALPQLQADLARETLKNPYNFDFLTLGKEAHERDLEMALTGHIQKFLLELLYKGLHNSSYAYRFIM